MEFRELMKNRYSVRKFDREKEVPADLIEQMEEAIYLAPTAENKQPLRVFTIRDKKRLEDIKKVTKYHYNAPLTIAVGYNPQEAWVRTFDDRNFGPVDASIAAMQMWLAAEDLGLGAVWVSSFDPEKMRELFPETVGTELVVLMQVGFPAEGSKPAGWHSKKREKSEIFSEI